MSRRAATPIAGIALCTLLLQASGTEQSSALHLREKKPLPPQLVDLGLYDDVIEINCEEKDNYLSFRGSELKPIVKVTLDCRLDTRRDRGAPANKYQELWYRNDLPLASKHTMPLPIPDKHRIGIFLKSRVRNLSDAEITALASTLVRLRLETILNRNILATVRIPNYAYPKLVLELQRHNFVSYKEKGRFVTTLIALPIETDLGIRETLCFLKNPP
ncbi:MAG: hypothetical protein K2X93_03690 [Candidatus Obscuribacterales bacterium]|nr:hypothetical protein [Candidatus Obscuribacterales bacterium]